MWRVGGDPVAGAAVLGALIERFVRDAAAAGPYNVGGPSAAVRRRPGQFFSEATHHDHVCTGLRT